MQNEEFQKKTNFLTFRKNSIIIKQMRKEKVSQKPIVGLELSMMRPFLEGLLLHMQGGIFTINKEKKLTFFSKSAMWITGFCLDDVIGRECKDIFRSNVCKTSCPFESVIKKGSSTYRSDIEILGKDRKAIPVNITAFVLKDSNDKIVGMVEIFRDISELKSLKNQLMQSDRFAILGQVAAGVAHEINNPLNGILTYIKLMSKKLEKEPSLAQKFHKYLSIMERETGNMGRIVKNLLDFSRRIEPEIMPLYINEVIEQSLLLLGDQLKIGNIEVKKESKPHIPEIMGDFGQLQQVFVNIILNSIQAMPKGGKLKIKTIAEGRLGQECFATVNISDTGCGISKKNFPKLFEPLFTTKRGKEGVGLGLGLPIVQRIIKEHHGNIDVKSTVGKGTTFSIRFPAK